MTTPPVLQDVRQQSVNAGLPFKPTALGAWCREHCQPYREFSTWSEGLSVLRPFPGLPSRENFSFERPRMFVGRVTDADAVPRDGYLCTSDGALIYRGLGARDYFPQADLGSSFRGIGDDGRFQIAIDRAAKTVPEECLFVGGNMNFGHFIFQSFLRLAALDWIPEVQNLPIAVYDALPKRYLEFFDLIGFPADRRIVIPMDGAVRFDRVWMVSSPMFRRDGGATMIWPEAIWRMRAKVAGSCAPPPGPRRRLYIPRGRAEWRRLVNEPELISTLARHGIETIDLGAMPAAEQIRTVANAEIIVSVLGAASQITLFSPPDCVQVQLTPPEFLGTFGPVAFAAVMGQPYARIYGRVATPEDVAIAGLAPLTSTKVIDADFTVDCGLLAAALPHLDRHCRRESPA